MMNTENANIYTNRFIKGFESKHMDTSGTFMIMPLGSRWQALLFNELGFHFYTIECQNFKRVV